MLANQNFATYSWLCRKLFIHSSGFVPEVCPLQCVTRKQKQGKAWLKKNVSIYSTKLPRHFRWDHFSDLDSTEQAVRMCPVPQPKLQRPTIDVTEAHPPSHWANLQVTISCLASSCFGLKRAVQISYGLCTTSQTDHCGKEPADFFFFLHVC